jgi:hypothetical protein
MTHIKFPDTFTHAHKYNGAMPYIPCHIGRIHANKYNGAMPYIRDDI